MKRNWKWAAVLALVCAVCLGWTVGALADEHAVYYPQDGSDYLDPGTTYTLVDMYTNNTAELTLPDDESTIELDATPMQIWTENFSGYVRTKPTFVTADQLPWLDANKNIEYGRYITLNKSSEVYWSEYGNSGSYAMVGSPIAALLTGGTVPVEYTPDLSSAKWSTDGYVLADSDNKAVSSVTTNISYTAEPKKVDFAFMSTDTAIYNGEEQTPKTTGMPSMVAPDKLVVEFDGRKTQKNVGKYIASFSVDPENHADYYDLQNTEDRNWVIIKLMLRATDVKLADLTYNGQDQYPVVESVSNVSSILSEEIKGLISTSAVRDVGDNQRVQLSLSNTDNIELSSFETTVNVKPIPVTMQWKPVDSYICHSTDVPNLSISDLLTLDADIPGLELTGTLQVDGVDATADNIMSLMEGSHTLTLKDAALSDSNCALTNPNATGTLTIVNMVPSGDITVEGTPGGNGWYTSEVSVLAPAGYTIISSDYSSNHLSLGKDFTKTDFSYRLQDNATGGLSQQMVLNIGSDTQAPVINVTNLAASLAKSQEVTVSVSDELSGVVDHYTNTAVSGEQTFSPNTPLSLSFDKNGTFVLTFTDNAGNQASADVTIDNIDTVPPTVKMVEKSSNVVLNANMGDTLEVTIICSDDVADAWNNSSSTSYSNNIKIVPGANAPRLENDKFVCTDNGTFDFYLEDTAGNRSASQTVTVDNFDHIAPFVSTAATHTPEGAATKAHVNVGVKDTGTNAYNTGIQSIDVTDTMGKYVAFTTNPSLPYTGDGEVMVSFDASLNGGY